MGNDKFIQTFLKQFLLAFALGMTVSSPWHGEFNANGGYIVVKKDGDVICYHFFDRNDLEGYLFLFFCMVFPHSLSSGISQN